MLSEYSSLSRKSLSVWVTGCCVSWQQWCLHTDVQYGGSIAPMREKKGICNLKRKHGLPEWSTFLSYLLCILKKEACQHAYLLTTTAPSSAQRLNLYVLFFFCFLSSMFLNAPVFFASQPLSHVLHLRFEWKCAAVEVLLTDRMLHHACVPSVHRLEKRLVAPVLTTPVRYKHHAFVHPLTQPQFPQP